MHLDTSICQEPCPAQDYGYTYWNNAPDYANPGYDATFFENAFAKLESMQANTLRLWLFFDGRSAPHFLDKDKGYNQVIGLETPLHEKARPLPQWLVLSMAGITCQMPSIDDDFLTQWICLQDLKAGKTQTFVTDFLKMLTKAQKHHIQVIPTLWSFEALNKRQADQTAFYGGHEKLFSDPACADAFVSHALEPLLDK